MAENDSVQSPERLFALLSGISVLRTGTTGQARLTALTPDSCWPMFMTMMETSCQRRERWESRESTDRWPSALSDWSSRRISDSSASTLSKPRSRCSAKADEKRRIARHAVCSYSPYVSQLCKSPFFAVFSSPLWMSMYLGLSGKKGSRRSSIRAGIPVKPSMRVQPGYGGSREPNQKCSAESQLLRRCF